MALCRCEFSRILLSKSMLLDIMSSIQMLSGSETRQLNCVRCRMVHNQNVHGACAEAAGEMLQSAWRTLLSPEQVLP